MAMTLPRPEPFRIASIDIFRALIMLLMIFVNDLWSLENIPGWLEHTTADYDGMGMADVVFPAFLFIVGLSIPFAIRNRISKGESLQKIAGHILIRSAALIIMGFFHVNFENITTLVVPVARPVYEILMTISFFLIWNVYPKDGRVARVSTKWLQGAGIIMLVLLALIYRGGSPENTVWMRPYWWGILGLIGWSYLVSSLVYLLARQKFWLITLMVVLFCFLNFQEFSPLFDHLPKLKVIISASNYSLVMCGVLASALFMQLPSKQGREWKYVGILMLLAIVFIGYGFDVRPLGGISKIKATPSWTAICAGISFFGYGLIFLIADKYRLVRWAKIIEPAGSMTLTCYLVPYLVYPLLGLVGWKWPEILTSGYIGLIKSLLFALVIIWMTGLLGKMKIKLRI
jgi:heparan-alpha-glucosaminide N-acetyltransferase